jgi:hypothetical protein
MPEDDTEASSPVKPERNLLAAVLARDHYKFK